MAAATSPASTIDCDALDVRFPDGTVGVEGANLHVTAGEIVALVGPSGCGKTTLLRTLAGLQAASQGSLRCDPPMTRGRLAFVFQQPSLLPWRSARQNVALPLELTAAATTASSRRAVATARLRSVELPATDHDKFPHELSGGMQMRVSIARALATDPSLLLLDEPFAALDDMLRNRLGELLLRLWRERRRTMVLVTHNIGEAVLLSHRVVVMRHGRLVGEVPITLPEPRDESLRRSPAFGTLYGRVGDLLRGGADA